MPMSPMAPMAPFMEAHVIYAKNFAIHAFSGVMTKHVWHQWHLPEFLWPYPLLIATRGQMKVEMLKRAMRRVLTHGSAFLPDAVWPATCFARARPGRAVARPRRGRRLRRQTTVFIAYSNPESWSRNFKPNYRCKENIIKGADRITEARHAGNVTTIGACQWMRIIVTCR